MVHVICFNQADDTNYQRCRIIPFLTCIDNGLKSSEGFNLALIVCDNRTGHRFSGLRGNIKHFSIILQCSVILICTYTRIIEMSKSRTIVRFHFKCRRLYSLTGHFRSLFIHRYYFKLISSGFDTYHIRTPVISIITYQFRIQFGIRAVNRLTINAIGRSPFYQIPSDIARFEPASHLFDGSSSR